MADEEQKDSIEHWTAILIAIVTVIAAVVAWRASVAADGAGDEDYDGLKAVVNVQEVTTVATVEAYQHAQAYANFRRYAEISNTLDEELAEASGSQAKDLEQRQAEADAMVDSKLQMFPNKFMDREGRYKADAEVGELVAAASRTRDLAPKPHFDQAEVLRTKAERLLMGVVFLSLGLVCLTLVESLEGGGRTGLLLLGVILGIGGTVFSVLVEVGKL
ncbi:MAG: hypothetical protein AMXMBFR33_27530 [Candidatus Xenobia bacterium]|jgi:hypothetical protein